MLEWLRFVENPITLGSLYIPGIPGMRMVFFSVLLIVVIIFRREGIMGMREFSWDWFFPRRRGEEAEAPDEPSGPMLEVKGVTLRFGGLVAVNRLSFSIEKGQIVGLIGPNGAGKTSAFNVISGFYKPTEGQVDFMGRKLTGLTPHAVCRAGLSRTFQNIRLFGNQTVLQNVMVGAVQIGRASCRERV